MIFQSNENAAQEKKNIELLMNSQVEGILVSLANTTTDFSHFELARQHNMPLVFFDRVLDNFRGDNVSAVILDDYQGAYQVVSHLIGQGCTRIAHLTGPRQLNIHRQQGYRDALTAHGLEINETYIAQCEMSQQGGARAIAEMLKLPQPPDAVFGSNDLAAAGAMQVIKAHGLRVPHEVTVAGFSNEAFATLTEPNLTSVDQGCETMGISAVRLLQKMLNPNLDRLAQPRNVVLKPRLIVRESSQRR